mmetsp:Transcript_46930/g.99727  ORF Transcript_46930/g.99727 Transcript_46930/m.99727 type:complete len:251 (-) Transcript_46930:110-862(-)
MENGPFANVDLVPGWRPSNVVVVRRRSRRPGREERPASVGLINVRRHWNERDDAGDGTSLVTDFDHGGHRPLTVRRKIAVVAALGGDHHRHGRIRRAEVDPHPDPLQVPEPLLALVIRIGVRRSGEERGARRAEEEPRTSSLPPRFGRYLPRRPRLRRLGVGRRPRRRRGGRTTIAMPAVAPPPATDALRRRRRRRGGRCRTRTTVARSRRRRRRDDGGMMPPPPPPDPPRPLGGDALARPYTPWGLFRR